MMHADQVLFELLQMRRYPRADRVLEGESFLFFRLPDLCVELYDALTDLFRDVEAVRLGEPFQVDALCSIQFSPSVIGASNNRRVLVTLCRVYQAASCSPFVAPSPYARPLAISR